MYRKIRIELFTISAIDNYKKVLKFIKKYKKRGTLMKEIFIGI